MLLSWCSTCSFSRRQPGPFALHGLSKSNQAEPESNPNSFFPGNQIMLIHTCSKTGKFLLCLYLDTRSRHFFSREDGGGPVLWGALTPPSKHSWGSSFSTFLTPPLLHQMERSARLRLPWMRHHRLHKHFSAFKRSWRSPQKPKPIRTCTSAGITMATNRKRLFWHGRSGKC